MRKRSAEDLRSTHNTIQQKKKKSNETSVMLKLQILLKKRHQFGPQNVFRWSILESQ